jgi:hypothetical protein
VREAPNSSGPRAYSHFNPALAVPDLNKLFLFRSIFMLIKQKYTNVTFIQIFFFLEKKLSRLKRITKFFMNMIDEYNKHSNRKKIPRDGVNIRTMFPISLH